MGKTPCCSSGGMKKGFWTPEEDFRLINCIQIHGEGNWRIVPLRAGLARCGKACRLRWMNYLRPDMKRGHISADEEDLILRLHKLVGNRWSLIAGRIPGRTDNEIKNHWNTHLSKRLGTRMPNHKKFRRSPLRIEEVHKEPMQNFKQISDGYYCNIQIPSDSTTMLGAGYDNSLEPMQNFNQKIDGYDARTAINDFSSSFKQISDGYGDHQLSSLPMPFISAGYENIIEDINSGENLVGRESNMQLQSTLLGADCNIQIPSSRVEIDEVDAKKGKCMVVNPSTITAECCEPFSALSDWLNAPNDYIPSVEDYWG